LTAIGSLSLIEAHAREKSLDPPRLAFMEDGVALLQSPVTREQLPEVLLTRLKLLQPYLENSLKDINKPTDFTRSSFDRIALNSSSATLDLLAGLACVM